MSIHNFKRTTVTAALLYANGPVHIGHLAGCYIPADIYVRYLRNKGEQVFFVTGSDEHGVPITIKAEKENITPQQVVDKYHDIIYKTFEDFGISPDIYSRTSNLEHHKLAQDFFKTIYNKKIFLEEETEQFYDPVAQKFLADRYIVGTCPVCGYDKAFGDQCEKCGSTLSPEELIEPYSSLSGEKPVKKRTKNWYLPLDQLQPKLEQYISLHADWRSNVYGQCMSWLKEGLRPRAMTRDLDWGITVPVDGAEGKVLYVWFDAPIGYISMTKEYFDFYQNRDYIQKHKVYIRSSPEKYGADAHWETWWKEKDTRIVHFIGKDNIVFHCLIFPAMMMAHGGYTLADQVPANEFLNLEGDKISTSRNWAVWAHEFLQDFPGKQDALRYFLTANAPESKDNNFTWKDFQTANNSELVGIIGNFINRTMVLTHKYYQGIVPEIEIASNEPCKTALSQLRTLKETLENHLDNFRFRDAIDTVVQMARLGNKFLAEQEPWKKVNTEPSLTKQIMYTAIQITSALAVYIEPFMPFTAKRLIEMLNAPHLSWENTSLQAGHTIGQAVLLFEKIENEAIQAQLEKLIQSKVTKAQQVPSKPATPEHNFLPLKSVIPFDDFTKLDIRIATILEAELVPKTDKLMKLKLDTGLDLRTVVSGIAAHYTPEQLVGQKVILLANLAPRTIKGIASQGMILMAENEKGERSLLQPQKDMPNGAVVR